MTWCSFELGLIFSTHVHAFPIHETTIVWRWQTHTFPFWFLFRSPSPFTSNRGMNRCGAWTLSKVELHSSGTAPRRDVPSVCAPTLYRLICWVPCRYGIRNKHFFERWPIHDSISVIHIRHKTEWISITKSILTHPEIYIARGSALETDNADPPSLFMIF